MEFLSYSSNIGILISSFQMMEFWPFFYKHWNYDLIDSNVEFLILWLYTLKFLPHRSKHWNSGPILTNAAIHILFFHCKHWNSCPIRPYIWIPALSLYTLELWPPASFLILGFWPSSNWNSYFILSLQTFELWSYSSKHWNSGPIFIQIDWFICSYFYKNWNSYPVLPLKSF